MSFRRHKLVAYGLLLLLPTLLMAGLAVRFLRHEQERLAEAEREVQRERLRTVADRLGNAVLSLAQHLQNDLRRVAPDRRIRELDRWVRERPLLRNAFVWQEERGLLMPDPARPACREEERFLLHYEDLFGDPPWRHAGDEGPRGVQRAWRGVGSNGARGGLTPWFSGNSLCLLAWHWDEQAATAVGVEVEMSALLARLIQLLPDSGPESQAVALCDGSGRVLHQVGGFDVVTASVPPQVRIPVGPELPHWELRRYSRQGAGPASAARLVFFSLCVLVGILLLGVLTAGALLWSEAQRGAREARRKTSFVANVSHELKTPLTSIRMYAELLAEDRVPPERRRSCLEVIVDQTHRLTRLVNNVLDFSRIEQNRKEYRVGQIDPSGVLETALEQQRPRFEEAGMQVIRELPDTPVRVRADRDALEQTLVNLFDNALKYAAEGAELTVTVRQSETSLELRIMDRGPGIPAGEQGRIFDLFHRADDSITRRQAGCGLGLTLARKMMRDMGGDLLFRPRPGGGACFVVRFADSANADTGTGKQDNDRGSA